MGTSNKAIKGVVLIYPDDPDFEKKIKAMLDVLLGKNRKGG